MMQSHSIAYFEREGRENLAQVLRVLKRTFKRRAELRSCKIVIFTAIGEGAALAYNALQEFDPQIIAVTFPLDFSVIREDKRIFPRVPDKLRALFDGLKIKIVTSRLPFDNIDGLFPHNEQMGLIKDVLTIVCGSFPQCIQAVLQACDHGLVEVGEKVISVTGDLACIITASTTKAFLSREHGLMVNEILCKPRNFTLARGDMGKAAQQAAKLIQEPVFDFRASKKKRLPTAEILEPEKQ